MCAIKKFSARNRWVTNAGPPRYAATSGYATQSTELRATGASTMPAMVTRKVRAAVALLIVRDTEFFRELCIDVCGFFGNMLNHGASGAAFDDGAKPRKIFGGADSINFHAAVTKIAHEAGKVQPLGLILDEIAEADALHDSRHQVTAGDLSVSH